MHDVQMDKDYNCLKFNDHMTMRAPVIVFAYKRLDKIKKCMESLALADESSNTDVFVFADGAKGEDDREYVNQVGEFLDGLTETSGFNSLNIKKHVVNQGLANSIISGVSEVIIQYNKAIVVEDDLIVAPDYLVYMNKALEFYEKDTSIWSITGYSEPLRSLKRYNHDVFYGYRGCSWGWGTWKDRWETVDWEVKAYSRLMHDKGLQRHFNRGGGDMTGMLRDQMEGKIDSWAIRWCFEQSMQNKYTVYPIRSLINNTGFDGSGTHHTISYRKLKTFDSSNKPIRMEKVKPDKRICDEFRLLHTDTLKKKIVRNMNLSGIKKQAKRLVFGGDVV